MNIRLLIFLLIFLNACQQEEVEKEIPLRTVKFITIEKAQNVSNRTFSGLTKAAQEFNVSFRVGGTITALPVKVGDQLKPRQLIAKIDAQQYQLEVQRARAAVAETQATLRNAQANFDRVKSLYENNNASRNDLDSARAVAESSKAQASASAKALELTQLNFADTTLLASQNCKVAGIFAEENENVTAGQNIAMLACGDQQEVEIDVPESLISQIKPNMLCQIYFKTLNPKKIPGQVTEIGISPTESGTTFPVTVKLLQKPAGLRSGIAVQVNFEFIGRNNKAPHYWVPATAVGHDSKGSYVYIVMPTTVQNEGITQRRAVSIGELSTAGLELLEGIEEKDKVVTAGISVIYDGLRVKFKNPRQ